MRFADFEKSGLSYQRALKPFFKVIRLQPDLEIDVRILIQVYGMAEELLIISSMSRLSDFSLPQLVKLLRFRKG